MKRVLVILSAVLAMLTSCKDRGDLPFNPTEDIKNEEVAGWWNVNSIDVYVVARNLIYASMRSVAESKMKSKVEDETDNVVLNILEEGEMYRYRLESDGSLTLRDSSGYYINTDTMYLVNPNVLGIYADKIYLNRGDTTGTEIESFTAYMQRSGIMELLEEDGSLSSTEMNMIREAVKDAQVNINFARYDKK